MWITDDLRKRGHCENFIRELKNGLDLHHYPCQKLNANRAYGSIAAISYNLMRFF
ncbi:MAG: transposase, partial [Oligoflexales bacterium]